MAYLVGRGRDCPDVCGYGIGHLGDYRRDGRSRLLAIEQSPRLDTDEGEFLYPRSWFSPTRPWEAMRPQPRNADDGLHLTRLAVTANGGTPSPDVVGTL